MFLCDYVFSWKLFSESDIVEDVIINMLPGGNASLADFKAAWYIGCSDGAPCSRIVLIDSEGVEYILPIRMKNTADQDVIHNFFIGSNTIQICELSDTDNDETPKEIYQLPLTGYASEHAMIFSEMTH